MVPPWFLAGSDIADPSAVLPRWGKTSVPAKAQAKQDSLVLT